MSDDLTKEELEIIKLQKEIKKLEAETTYYNLLIAIYYSGMDDNTNSDMGALQ